MSRKKPPGSRNRKPRFKSRRLPVGETGYRGNQVMIAKLLAIADETSAKSRKDGR